MSRRQLFVGTAIILALGAHVGWWYWPRERAGRLAEGSLTAAVLTASELPYRAWVAYPHQNLGRLERFRGRSGAVARLAEVPLPDLPSFGPLPTPPAIDMAVASAGDGDRFVLAARVYPVAARLARWAGRLAANPWLAGGVVETDGERAEIAWRGSTWTVTRRASLPAPGPATMREENRMLAAVALAEPSGPLPAGLYVLRRRAGLLELATGDGRLLEAPAFLAEAGRPLVILERSAEVVDALALLDASADGQLPRWAVVHHGRGRRRSIPGERLYELLGREPLQTRSGNARLAGTDRPALEAAAGLSARLTGAGEALAGLSFVAAGDLAATAEALGPLVEELVRLPLRESRRWGALLEAAGDLGDWSQVTVLVAEGVPEGAVIRLVRGRPAVAGD